MLTILCHLDLTTCATSQIRLIHESTGEIVIISIFISIFISIISIIININMCNEANKLGEIKNKRSCKIFSTCNETKHKQTNTFVGRSRHGGSSASLTHQRMILQLCATFFVWTSLLNSLHFFDSKKNVYCRCRCHTNAFVGRSSRIPGDMCKPNTPEDEWSSF